MGEYIPGHSAILAYQLEPTAITDPDDGSAPTLPAIPASPVAIGYTNVPEVLQRLNNKMGYGIGSPEPLYRTRGRVEPEISFEIKLGALAFLQYCLRPNAEADLPALCLYYGVQGAYCECIRFAKCNEARFMFGEGGGGEGSGGELTANVSFWGIAPQARGTALSITPTQLRAFGTPLMWHDVRTFKIQKQDATWLNMRKTLISQTFTYNNNLERKNQRTNWGDHIPLSRTCYDIMPRSITVTGESSLHTRLDPNLIREAANSQDWGDIEIYASDNGVSPAGETAKHYTLAARDVMPDTVTQRGVDAGAQMGHGVSIVGRNMDISLVAP